VRAVRGVARRIPRLRLIALFARESGRVATGPLAHDPVAVCIASDLLELARAPLGQLKRQVPETLCFDTSRDVRLEQCCVPLPCEVLQAWIKSADFDLYIRQHLRGILESLKADYTLHCVRSAPEHLF